MILLNSQAETCQTSITGFGLSLLMYKFQGLCFDTVIINRVIGYVCLGYRVTVSAGTPNIQGLAKIF